VFLAHLMQFLRVPVAGPRGFLDLMPGQPLIEQVAECDVGPRCRVVPDLVAYQYRRVFGVGRAAERQLFWLSQLAHRGVVEDLADKLSTRVPVQGSPKLVTSLS
jgi:hypothetical protein